MKSKLKYRLLLFAKIFGAIIVVLTVLFFIYREELLQKSIQKITTKIAKDYNAKFTLKNAKFDGLTAVSVEEVSLVPAVGDTLFAVQKAKASISFWHLFIGEIQLGTLEAKNGYIQLIKNENGKNFDAFLKKSKTQKPEVSTQKRNYAETAYQIITKILNLVPSDMVLENLTFRVDDMGKKASVYCDKLTLDNEELESNILIKTDAFSQRLKLSGMANPRGEECDIRFFNLDTGAIQIPYIKERFGISSSFNSIRLNVENIDMDGDELHLDGSASINNLKINHPKIALNDVVVRDAKFDYRFLIGPDYATIDSTSVVQINKLKFNPYLSINTEKDTIYKLNVKIPKMPAQDYITSLPDGLFENVKGMKMEGDFDFKLNFMFNINQPESVVLDSKLNKYGLKILQYGKADLSKLNQDFEYRALIDDVLQRPIFVGLSNPNYTTLDQISPYLQKCVLTTEDPSFMRHKGFVTEAFKVAIIKNFKNKRFSNGGSTISMQLVKNIFLTREKTLSRKLEEILLVFILENNQIVNKERMLEVYFNIIEWGPDVYGIAEASDFYFQKKPIDLSLNECLFLANIIPSPRKFMYRFNGSQSLSDATVKKNNYITNIMIKKGLLTEDDLLNRYQTVSVTGRAKQFIKIREIVQDTIVQDSLKLDEEFEF